MNKRLRAIIVLILVGIVLSVALTYFLTTKNDVSNDVGEQKVIKIIKPDILKTKMMFFGDVFWGRYVNDWSMASDLKEAYPFSGLHTLNREKYQAWIGSLNCPITDNQVSSTEQEALLMFNCTPNYLPEAAKWFNVFSLANSHTDNQGGMEGFNRTKTYLDENYIQYFGHFNKEITDEICEIITIPTKAYRNNLDYSKELMTSYPIREFSIPIAMCGYHNTFALPTQDQLDEISKYTDRFITLVYAIQGSEYNTTADGLQRQYFHAMIDEGADAVIGKGAHVVQDTESYNGKPIIYSMGNFVYDQQATPDVRHGIGVDVGIQLEYNDNLEGWQKISMLCAKFKDECLNKSRELNLEKPDYKISYDIVATDNTGRVAHKGSAELQNQMLVRANWQSTIENLSNN